MDDIQIEIEYGRGGALVSVYDADFHDTRDRRASNCRNIRSGAGLHDQGLAEWRVLFDADGWGPNLDEAQAASFETMVKRAESLGANAIIGIQYNLACPESGFMSFICYGTAVAVEKC